MKTLPILSRASKKAGFSLIEVTLAIGIVSVSLVSILGSVSVGLNTIHDAKKDMTHAQVISQVTSMVIQTPFDQIADSGPYYFDQAGRQIDSVEGALYTGTLAVAASSSDIFPGAPSGISTSAKTVKITVSTIQPGTNRVISSSHASVIVPKS